MTEAKASTSKSTGGQKSKGSAAFVSAAEDALDAMETANRETIEATGKAGQEAMAEAYDKAASFGTAKFGNGSETYEKMVEEGKKNLTAMTKSAESIIAGMTACNASIVDGLKTGLKFNLAYFEKMASKDAPQNAMAAHVESMAEAVDLSSAKSMEYGKILSETYAKAYIPLKKRFDSSVKTFSESLS